MLSSDMGSYMSRNIDMIAESAPTDRLKIVKGGGDLNEFAVYGYAVSDEEIAGDVNADGKFNVSDIVMMQKWLLCSGDLTDWKAGDLNKDNVINVFDLCLMRRMLAE